MLKLNCIHCQTTKCRNQTKEEFWHDSLLFWMSSLNTWGLLARWSLDRPTLLRKFLIVYPKSGHKCIELFVHQLTSSIGACNFVNFLKYSQVAYRTPRNWDRNDQYFLTNYIGARNFFAITEICQIESCCPPINWSPLFIGGTQRDVP